MKRILFLSLITLVICSFTKAEKVKWYSWNEGYELAKKENKPILLFVQATWCNTCKRLNDKTFNNADIVPIIQKDYIPVKYDVDTDIKITEGFKYEDQDLSGKALLLKFLPDHQLGIPLTVIWVPGAEKQIRIQGLKDPEEMKEILLGSNK